MTLRNYQPVAWVLYQWVIDQSKADIFINPGIIIFVYKWAFFISILVRSTIFFYEMMISVVDQHNLYTVSTLYQQSTERQTCHSTQIQYTLTTVQTDRHVTPLGFSTLLTTVHRQTDMSLHSYSVHFNNSSDRPTCHSTQILSMMLHEVLFYLNWIVVNIWYSGTCAIWHLHFPTLCDIRQKFMVPKYFS